MIFPKIFLAALALVTISAGASAQTKAESRLYGKTLAKPSLEAYDKFLKRFPESVYAADIEARKDTLLNISPYTPADAEAIAAGFLSSGSLFKAFPQRSSAVDMIYAICIAAPDLDENHVRLYTLEFGSDGWILNNSYESPSSGYGPKTEKQFVDSTSCFRIAGKSCFRINYLASVPDSTRQPELASGSRKLSYVAGTWIPQDDSYTEVKFIGKDILQPGDSLDYRIEGRSNESSLVNTDRTAIRMMLADMQKNPGLVQIPEGDYVTDAAIEWWIGNNPEATTSATSVNMNILPENSSLVERFNSEKDKKSSSKYTASLFDIRGYSVIVVKQKSDGKYLLAWAEPECKDHYRDRLLNNILFDGTNNLKMYYYHGRQHFDYELNLASKSIRR